MSKQKLLVVSLDAVSSNDLDILAILPNFNKLMSNSTLVKNVDSIYISNTYPIHTSMITGVYPNQHGIIDNTYLDYDNPYPLWRWYFSLIEAESIVSQAIKSKLKIASVFWPVMAKAPIKYNLPEILARDHENQIAVVLKNSTKLFALYSFLRHGRNINGSQQPQLDNFSTTVACELLSKQKVDLLMLHLTDVDTAKHYYGIASSEALAALKRMDDRLGQLVKAAGNNYQILVVSDHSQVDVKNHINLNDNNPFKNTWWHLSEGSAVLIEKEKLDDKSFAHLQKWLKKQPFFKRALTTKEMEDSGFSKQSRLAIVAKPDWALSLKENNHIGNHGYTLDLPNYQAFYLTKGNNVIKNQILKNGSILDICPLILQLLDFPDFSNKGKLKEEIFNK